MKRNTAGKTKGRGTGLVLGRTLAFLAVTVVLILAILMGVIWVLAFFAYLRVLGNAFV